MSHGPYELLTFFFWDPPPQKKQQQPTTIHICIFIGLEHFIHNQLYFYYEYFRYPFWVLGSGPQKAPWQKHPHLLLVCLGTDTGLLAWLSQSCRREQEMMEPQPCLKRSK